MRKIIIPAAGKAERFNGILKELAPIDNSGTTVLQNTIQTAVHKLLATHITIVTNEQKQHTHTDYIKAMISPSYPNISFSLVLQTGEHDLLSGIASGLNTPPYYVEGGLLLPDTIVDIDVVEHIAPGITFGVFKTSQPERFSIIQENTIYTKVRRLGKPYYDAWGIVLWSQEVGQDMLTSAGVYTHYDEMFRNMMWQYDYTTFPIRSYYDIGSIEHYMQYMDENL